MRKYIVLLLVALLFLIATAMAADFNITTTTDFDAGAKLNTTTTTDRYNQSAGNAALDFPYAEKDGDLVSYWRFENNTNDETENHNDGTAIGATYTTSGKFGGAYYFDGTDDYILVGGSSSLDSPATNNKITLVMWIKNADISQTLQYVLNYKGNTYAILYGYVANTYEFYNTGGTIRYSMGTISDTNWHFTAFTFDGATDKARGYLDAVVQGSSDTETDNLVLGSGSLTIGAPNNLGAHFNGTIDGIKVYNRTLSATEIEALYNEGLQYKQLGTWESAEQTTANPLLFTTIKYLDVDASNYIDKVAFKKATNPNELENSYLRSDANLINYFRFEDNLNDEAGNSVGTPSGPVSYTAGKFGDAFNTDGGTVYIGYGTAVFGETGNVTFSAWIYPTTTTQYQYILASGGETAAEGIAMRFRGDTHTIFVGRTTLTAKYFVKGAGNVPLNQWTMVTGAYDSSYNGGTGILRAYINGEYLGGATASSAGTYSRLYNLTVGRNARLGAGSYPFHGYIDDTAIFNRSLTATEIADLYEGMKAKYDTNITSGTSLTITDSELTLGSFEDLGNDFKIKLFFDGDGNHTPSITEVSGYYEDKTSTPSRITSHLITHPIQLPDNNTGVPLVLGGFVIAFAVGINMKRRQ